MSERPNVLIFGGLDRGTSSVLVQYLLPPLPAEPLVTFIRFIDKYSIHPPTTYVPNDFLKLMDERKGVLEYRQANLTSPAVVTQCFNPAADGRPFTYVFDYSGSYSLTELHEIQISHTFTIALNLGREASRRQLKAYIRIHPSFYDHRDEHEKFTEKDLRGWVPLEVRGVWYHEALRAIGSFPGLPLVALRHGRIYGAGTIYTESCTSIIVGKVYKKTKRQLILPLPRKLRKNLLHAHDLAAASWLAAEWIASMTRENADGIAGVGIPPSGSAEVAKVSDAVQSSTPTVTIPLFNLEDGSDTTQETLSEAVSKAFGVSITYSDKRLTDEEYYEQIEDINGDNVGHWSEIINNSNPPVPDTPLSPYVMVKDIKERGTALDGSKIRQILSFSPKYSTFGVEAIQQYITWCEAQGIWPIE